MLQLATGVSSQSMLQESALLAFSKAIADQLRIQILRVLKNHSYGVTELCYILDIRQSNMSHHLKILTQAGLLVTRKEGNTVFYLRAFAASLSSLTELQQSYFAALDKMPLESTIADKVEDIHKERLTKSQQFFQQNAEQFQQHQELISPYDNYAPQVADVLKCHIKGKMQSALEVGPGKGEFLSELSPLFDKVFALDNSQSMLQLAQQHCIEKKLDNVEFFHGDTRHPWLNQLSVDFVIVNMVLHHHPSPLEMFADLATVCKQQGNLLITDLVQHKQEWAKQNCGDLWLGFTHEEILHWAEQAGFKLVTEANISQRNGFSVLIKLFQKL